jgi:hypothetical protein
MTACGAHKLPPEIAARILDANRKHAHFLNAPTATGTRRARTCHLHQVGRQAQMTQLQYYPQTQTRQGADRDRTSHDFSTLESDILDEDMSASDIVFVLENLHFGRNTLAALRLDRQVRDVPQFEIQVRARCKF